MIFLLISMLLWNYEKILYHTLLDMETYSKAIAYLLQSLLAVQPLTF